MGQRHRDDLATQALQPVNGAFHCLAHLVIQAVAKIFFRDAEFQATHRLLQFGNVIGNGHLSRRRIHRVAPGNSTQDNS